MSEREEEIEWVLAENKYGPRDAMRGFHGYNVRGMAVDIIALRQRVSELGEQLAAAKADAGNILAGRRAEADALHQRLTNAERERDEARRERDALKERDALVMKCPVCDDRKAHAHCVHELRHRAERAEAVVDKARRMRDAGPQHEEALYDAIDDFDAAEAP